MRNSPCFNVLKYACVSFGARMTFNLNPLRSRGGALKAPPPLRFFAFTHLILELHYCALGTFPPKK